MGLLDKIKPQAPQVRPIDMGFDDASTLRISWDDGATSNFAPRWLRARCPCAGCVEEWTGKRTVGEAQVDPSVHTMGMVAVGNYAIQINWSDGHTTGIYSWDYLLKLRLEQASPSA